MKKLFVFLGALALTSCQSAADEQLAPAAPEYELVEPVTAEEPIVETSASLGYTVGAPSEVPSSRVLEQSEGTQSNRRERQDSRTPLTPFDLVDQLFDATAVFTIGEHHNIDDTIRAQLAIGAVQTVEQLIAEMEADPSVVIVEDAKISRTISATLTSPGFEVSTPDPRRQAVVNWESTRWSWDLRPKYSGKLPVTVSVIAHIHVDGEKVERSIKTFERTVMIEITPWQRIVNFVNSYWQWLVTTLLIPLSICIWRLIHKQRTMDRS